MEKLDLGKHIRGCDVLAVSFIKVHHGLVQWCFLPFWRDCGRDMVASIDSGTLPMPASITQLLFLYAHHLKENVDEDVATSPDSQTNEQRSANILDRLFLEKQAHHLGFSEGSSYKRVLVQE
jgi:hypothetical protein